MDIHPVQPGTRRRSAILLKSASQTVVWMSFFVRSTQNSTITSVCATGIGRYVVGSGVNKLAFAVRVSFKIYSENFFSTQSREI